MTTIATKDGIVASDSQWVMNGAAGKGPDKLWVSKRTGSALGFSGDMAWLVLFREWYESGANRNTAPDIRYQIEGAIYVIELASDGRVCLWDIDFVPMPFLGEFVAIGSGSKFAMGAMAGGVSARQAVRVACQLDLDSGLPVRWRRARKK